MTILGKNGVMINLSTMVSRESLMDYIAEIPTNGSVVKFAYGDYRFTIEHHGVLDWTIVIEKIDPEQLHHWEEHINTFELETLLKKYL